MEQTKMKIAYVITQRKDRNFWNRVGVAFVNSDGSINVKLEAVPVSGEIQIRDYQPRDELAKVSPAASTAREASAASRADFSPAGAEPRGDEGGGLEAPAARPSWFVRTRATFRNSVWAPVALKLMGLALAMVALSGIG